MRLAASITLSIGLLLCMACGQTSSTTSPLPTAHIVIASPQTRPIVSPTPSAVRVAQAATSVPTIAPTPVPTLVDVYSPPAGSSVVPEPTLEQPANGDTQPATLEAQLVAEINRVRADNHLPPYRASTELSAAARAHSCDLAAHHIISHTSSDGRTLAERLAASTPPWEWPSESIAAGTDDPITVVAMWMDEPADGWHRRNILDQQQQEVGAGYCFAEDDPSGNHHYWTADFSRRTSSGVQ